MDCPNAYTTKVVVRVYCTQVRFLISACGIICKNKVNPLNQYFEIMRFNRTHNGGFFNLCDVLISKNS